MRLRLTLLLGLLSGCATTAPVKPEASSPADASASAAPQAVDLEALAARELPPLPRQALSTPDRAFTGEVEAAGTPTFEQEEGFQLLTVPLGTGTPLVCFLYAEPVDTGGALHRMLTLVGQSTQVQAVRITDVRRIGDNPAVYVEAHYLVDSARGKAAGVAKLMVSASAEAPLVCTHDELGYSETFQRVTSGLAGSLKGREPQPAPRYSELHLLRVKGHTVGFEKRTVQEVPGGSRLTEVETSFFMPRSSTELVVRDVVTTELADADGKLVARDYARATNGQLDIQMGLEQVKGREYRYEGVHEGKQLSGTFTASEDLATEPSTARRVREQLLTGKAKELNLLTYYPAVDPAAPVPQVLRKGPAGGREVIFEQGEARGHLLVDAQGMVEKLVLSIAELEMTQERVAVSGKP